MKKLILIFSSILVLSSCSREEFLDIKPKGVIIPTTVNDYRLMLDQVDFRLNISPGFGASHSNTDYMSDDWSFAVNPRFTTILSGRTKNMYTWADDFYDANQEDPDWQTLYGQIYVTNIVLEEIMDATEGTMEEILAVQADALVQRAFAYFILVNQYGPHYNPATAESDLAVPLRLDSALDNVDLTRKSVETIYDLILADVTKAFPNLPQTPELKHRPSKVSTLAFLARIHLYMGNFDEARTAANEALDIHNTLLNYNEVPDWFFPGIIDLPLAHENPEVLWFKKSTNPYRFLPLAPELEELIAPNDQRRRTHAGLSLFGISGPERINVLVYGTNYRFTGFSVPELYLIRAETNARLGNIQAALTDLNTLREKRLDSGTFEPLESSSTDEVLDLVKREKRLEYMAQGHRLFDLKRYNVYDTEKVTITHITPSGEEFILEPGSKRWVVPIAPKYILQNPEIGENDRN